ncbi:MAG TPA: tyrosine-type recombinase/integrase [Candidatus Dormibacteraeota bacterium]|nr:tyrosine-type recombinase/integrase [Candidatus Dormibacteraeota bacterium]
MLRARRRGNHFGGITARKRGGYAAYYSFPGGKRMWRYGSDRDVLEKWLAELRDDYLDGHDPSRVRRQTVAQYLEGWADRLSVTKRRKSELPRARTTIDGYERQLRRYVVPVLGQLLLTELKSEHIERLYAWLAVGHVPADRATGRPAIQLSQSGGGLSPQTIVKLHWTFGKALEDAVGRNLIRRNPIANVDLPAIPEGATFHAKVLPIADLRRVLSAVETTPNGAAVGLAALAGLRRGEILALRWADVHLDGKDEKEPWLSVSASLQRVRIHEAPDDGPRTEVARFRRKSAESKREISIPRTAANLLRRHRAWQASQRKSNPGWRDEEYVFCSPRTGGSMDSGYLTRRVWHPIREQLGLAGCRLHDFRHTLQTHEHLAGTVPVKVQAPYLGHGAESMTLGTYTHINRLDMRLVADLVDRLLIEPQAALLGESIDQR